MAGLEVDSMDPVAGLFNIVVGEVIQCAQHPDADKVTSDKSPMSVKPTCSTSSVVLLIVVRVLKVAVAKVGAVLPGDFKSKKAKLRGQPSHVMLLLFKS